MGGRAKFTVAVACGAVAALVVLGAWLMHPAMAAAGEAGGWFVGLLMLAVILTAALMLFFRRGKGL
jgi:hypothetical protein